MKVLLDHCVDEGLRNLFAGHEMKTAREMGWEQLDNGKLLKAAAGAGFDVLITVDRNLRHQQNMGSLQIGIIVLKARTNRLVDLARGVPGALLALKGNIVGRVVEVDAPPPKRAAKRK